MRKEEIRNIMKCRKRQLSGNDKREAASRVFGCLEATGAFMQSDNILIYHSLPDELPTVDFLLKWHRHKHLFLPRVNGEDLDILPFSPGKLQTGAFNIEEPTGDDIADISNIEMIIVPAIAYDRNGNRVGRGKGYYDRLLQKSSHTIKIGVGYDFQLVDNIEVEPHDIPVDAIITEKFFIKTDNNKDLWH
ncbi:MAG: 5-formyltetrahydrofolate cyclo-ligase [Muribaculaceae bacterium]|nr:5-formyltetrahydrofolate cyclo-ligase [Muribaculaceae bacterium]